MSRLSVFVLLILGVTAFVATFNTLTMIYGGHRNNVDTIDDGFGGQTSFKIVKHSSKGSTSRKPLRPQPQEDSQVQATIIPVVKRPENLAGGKTRKKRYFHTAMTCNENSYSKWQSRIMYFYYKKYKDEPESEMGGFTRVLHSGKPDNLMDEIPSFVVDPLPPGKDMGYVVLNRPWAFVQWLEKADIPEEYVWMAEPDHIILKPIPNLSTEHMPAGFPFFYIVPREQEKHLRRWYPKERGEITNIDPVGNSPVIIKKEALKKIAPLWMNVSMEMKSDPAVDKEFGWVLEMYGYATASAMLGYTHILRKDFMIQPPWDRVIGDTHIIHYTYGCDFNPQGIFTPGKVGAWHFDKRDHQTAIPRNLSYPPKPASESVFELIRRINDATWSIPDWQEGAV